MRPFSLVPFVIALAACGARSGLEVAEDARASSTDASMDASRGRDASTDAARGPDASIDAFSPPPPDAPPDAGRDAPIDACSERSLVLTPIRPEIMFVVDRSTSMSWSLTGPGGPGPTRWSILVDALRERLPVYDARSDMGLVMYPAEGGDRCSVASDPQLAPAVMQAEPILDRVTTSSPGGRTPTASGLEAAERWFLSHPDISHVRAVVLATDGAPNCNEALDPRRCPCTAGSGLPVGCMGDSQLCLDDARTLAVIERMAAREVPTYVIGIDGDPDPALSDVLREMALAGGRPNPLDPRRAYYSVRNAGDLSAAFDRIQASIVSCSLAVELAGPTDRPVVVTLDGEVVPRDPSRTEGWEWSADREQTILLYGEACTRAQMGSPELTLEILCG
jgi:hypothetical protein